MLVDSDYRKVLLHLRYPYTDAHELRSRLERLQTEYGQLWVTELQQLLTELDTAKEEYDTEVKTKQVQSVSIAGEQSVSYSPNYLGLNATSAQYNSKLGELVRLTGIAIDARPTKIVR